MRTFTVYWFKTRMNLHFCEAIEIKDLTDNQQNEKESKTGLFFERKIFKGNFTIDNYQRKIGQVNVL